MGKPTRRVPSVKVSASSAEATERTIPEEVAVALVYDGSAHAVMMATPADLEDFALGFSLTERVIERASDLKDIEIVEQENGIEVRLWLTPASGKTLAKRRRRIAGPTGCGLCGVESLEAAMASPRTVGAGCVVSPEDIRAALADLPPRQTLNRLTRAVHGAAFWTPKGGIEILREDVGRHNALDKLVGAMSRSGSDAAGGMVLLTSRVSVEMVQKTAAVGASIIVAVSAPTALAVRTAELAGITLVAVAREDSFEIFTRPDRIVAGGKAAHEPRREVAPHAA